ncbi:atp-dependent helicase [Fusarium heterosporum]|uniref:Atp-dependent helicase n=1 Tax=Fusarium heterosporum TaxID=42747 RepID=A0A8H5TFN8_FUSHE|nr:atp-dependent helicase [Fusarium heterosporum]
MAPHIATEHNLGEGMPFSNPYPEQFKLSALVRAVESDAAPSCLTFNKRAFGDVVSISNTLFYHGTMHTKSPSNRPEALPAFLVRVKEHVSADQPNCFYSLVEFVGARSNAINTFQANKAHHL